MEDKKTEKVKRVQPHKVGENIYLRPALHKRVKQVADKKTNGKFSPAVEKMLELVIQYGLWRKII